MYMAEDSLLNRDRNTGMTDLQIDRSTLSSANQLLLFGSLKKGHRTNCALNYRTEHCKWTNSSQFALRTNLNPFQTSKPLCVSMDTDLCSLYTALVVACS